MGEKFRKKEKYGKCHGKGTAPVASEERCQDEGWMLQCAGAAAAGGGAPGGGREVVWRHPLRTNQTDTTSSMQRQPQGVQGEEWRFSFQLSAFSSSLVLSAATILKGAEIERSE